MTFWIRSLTPSFVRFLRLHYNVIDISMMKRNYMKKCRLKTEVCLGLFDNFDVTLYLNYVKRYNATIHCSKLGLCSEPRIVKEGLEEYQRKVLLDKPPREYPQSVTSENPMKFVVFTDVHIDPNYTQTKSTHCNSSLCCRNDSPDVHDDKDRPGKWGVVGQCDLPYVIFPTMRTNQKIDNS